MNHLQYAARRSSPAEIILNDQPCAVCHPHRTCAVAGLAEMGRIQAPLVHEAGLGIAVLTDGALHRDVLAFGLGECVRDGGVSRGVTSRCAKVAANI
ncbi:MAG: hypothetical protein WCS20_11160 [Alphaproteobacteria bacterium]